MNAVVVPMQARPGAREPVPIPDRQEYIERLRQILSALEADDQPLFEARLNQLMRLREDGLFVNLAKLTRELHQAVRDLNFDERLQQLAGSEIPDACVRLDYVAKLGEDAAHRTLDLVDSSRGLIDSIGGCVTNLADARRHLQNCSGPSPLGSVGSDLEEAESALVEAAAGLRANFSAISQAQEYQDLSGQVIRRVISLVHNIEGALIKLLRATSEGVRPGTGGPSEGAGALAGPAVPGLSVDAASQQDADALLAELGF